MSLAFLPEDEEPKEKEFDITHASGTGNEDLSIKS